LNSSITVSGMTPCASPSLRFPAGALWPVFGTTEDVTDVPLQVTAPVTVPEPVPFRSTRTVTFGSASRVIAAAVASSRPSARRLQRFQEAGVHRRRIAEVVVDEAHVACSGLNPTCAVVAYDHRVAVANFTATTAMVTSFYHLDRLGSVRAITDAGGASSELGTTPCFTGDSVPPIRAMRMPILPFRKAGMRTRMLVTIPCALLILEDSKRCAVMENM
jgi:hypothetical protein